MSKFDNTFFNRCANDRRGPVALTLSQILLPVEGSDAVIFPPTYAGIDYSIDELSDGTRVATIDSVGSQANRMEPIFKEDDYKNLVPQVDIDCEGKSFSIFEVGHRLGDAIVRSTELGEEAQNAFSAFLDNDNAALLARLAPTSLVFGVWDSRETQAKLPRIVNSVIRAWNIDKLKRSAQYKAPVNYAELGVFSETDKNNKSKKEKLSERGFLDAPSVDKHGGVVVHGDIRRTVTVNLVALRRLNGDNEELLRSYVLGLALVAATAPLDCFLRQGCLLTPDPATQASWAAVNRDGTREAIMLDKGVALDFAKEAAKKFGVIDKKREVKFNLKLAKKDLAKKDDAKNTQD